MLNQGVSTSRIIYANPCKQASFLRYAAKHNVSLMTFDNEAELYKIKDIYPTAKYVHYNTIEPLFVYSMYILMRIILSYTFAMVRTERGLCEELESFIFESEYIMLTVLYELF